MKEERFGTEQEETGGRVGGGRGGREERGKEREVGRRGESSRMVGGRERARGRGEQKRGGRSGGGVDGREEGEVGEHGMQRKNYPPLL